MHLRLKIALYLAWHLMEPLAGTLFWDAAGRAFKKIRASLGNVARRYAERFRTMFHQTTGGASDYSKKADLIDELMVGIEDRRAVFLTYQPLYDLRDFQASKLVERIRERDFPAVAEAYKLIDNHTIDVLVPYDRTVFNQLVEEIRNVVPLTPKIIRDWTPRATPHSVSLIRPQRPDDLFWSHLEVIPFSRERQIDRVAANWFFAQDTVKYDRTLGLPQITENYWIA